VFVGVGVGVGVGLDVLGEGGGAEVLGNPLVIENVGFGVLDVVGAIGVGVNVGFGLGTDPFAAIICLLASFRCFLPAR
jgi:hypothetical protein